jgi:preprotein translocase subunit SecF
VEFFKKQTNIDFVGIGGVCAVVSGVICAAALILIFTRGFNFGIDFAGGTLIQLSVPAQAGDVDEGRVREGLTAIGLDRASVVRFGSPEDRAFLVNLRASSEEERDLPVKVQTGLSEKLGATVELQRVESVGPRVGKELRRDAIWATVFSCIAILIYVWFRFDLRFAPGAVLALIHDVLVTAGVFVAFGLEFDQNVLAALLIIIGYSINDTIVIYDRIREVLELRGGVHLEEVVNQAVNQTLSRTVLTSGATLVTVLAMLILGGPVLFGFALALTIGIVAGSYSTIYVASALLIWLERRFRRAAAPAKAPAKAKA